MKPTARGRTDAAGGHGWPCLDDLGDGRCALHVAASPNARQTAAEGLHDGCLRLRLAAPPVDGKANEVLLDWLAAELRLPRRGAVLLRGATARRKTVALDAPAAAVSDWLQALIGGPSGWP